MSGVDLSPELLAALYAADPDQFLSVRTSLAADAKAAGDADLARGIAAQRKPTVAAWVVNRQVHAEPAVVPRLVDLGTRLRAAHEHLDAATLRELSAERRQLVTESTRAALAGAGRDDAAAALRDEVADTFDAAVADPQVAARLGRLTRAEKWSGFGVAMDAPSGAPELTVIRGGRDHKAEAPVRTAARTPSRTAEKAPRDRAESTRQTARDKARGKAAEALAAADTALHDSAAAEHSAAQHVRDLTAELARVQQQLVAAKRDHDRSRQDVRSARSKRREAQTALNRAERPGKD